MKTRTFRFDIPEEVLGRTASAVQEHMLSQHGEEYSADSVRNALETWLDRKFDLVAEEVPERLTAPGSEDAREFARILQEAAATLISPAAEREAVSESAATDAMFTGYRQFSPTRLTAMMAYLAEKSRDVYKTKLNKLLFYADLSGYYLTGQGLSGARYVNMHYGPVPDTYEEMIRSGERAKTLAVSAIPEQGENVRVVKPGENAPAAFDELTDDDKCVLEWVAETYGQLSTSDIVDVSHAEMAYRNTERGESISYRYAQFLNILPPKDLLRNY